MAYSKNNASLSQGLYQLDIRLIRILRFQNFIEFWLLLEKIHRISRRGARTYDHTVKRKKVTEFFVEFWAQTP